MKSCQTRARKRSTMLFLDVLDITVPLASEVIHGPMLVTNFQHRHDEQMPPRVPRGTHQIIIRMHNLGHSDGSRGFQAVCPLRRSRNTDRIQRPRKMLPKHSRTCAKMRRKSRGPQNLLHHRLETLQARNLQGSELKPRLAPGSPDTIPARRCQAMSLPYRTTTIPDSIAERYLHLHLNDQDHTRCLIL